MSSVSLATLAALALVGSAFRVKPAKRGESSTSKAVGGLVDGLFTYGAPGTSSPGIKNPRRSDGCFPGKRFWTTRPQWFGLEVDTVVPIAGVIGFRHAKMDGVDLNDKKKTYTEKKCDDYLMDYPTGLPKTELHELERYIGQSEVMSEFIKNVSNIALRKSFVQDPAEAARRVAEYGWNLVTTAIDDGSSGGLIGGRQVSHLIQNPHNLECIITFQGSSSFGDWLANAMVAKVSFCGLGPKVHAGFKDHLLRMTKSPIFQSRVRPYLQSCSKVNVAGHSLGGAMAELYTACAMQHLQPGDKGYDDYKYMGWSTVGKARKLPAVVEAVA